MQEILVTYNLSENANPNGQLILPFQSTNDFFGKVNFIFFLYKNIFFMSHTEHFSKVIFGLELMQEIIHHSGEWVR